MPAPSTVERLQNWLDTYGPWETRDHFTGPIGFSLVSSALADLEALHAVAEAAEAFLQAEIAREELNILLTTSCAGNAAIWLHAALANLPQPTEP